LAAVVTVRQHLSRCVPALPGRHHRGCRGHGRPRCHGCCGPRRPGAGPGFWRAVRPRICGPARRRHTPRC